MSDKRIWNVLFRARPVEKKERILPRKVES